MSNLERRPQESLVGGSAATAVVAERGSLLAPREVPLGGPRGILVRRTLPHRDVRTVGAWCFVDHYGPHDVAGAGGMRVPPHPHTGLQTVSWLIEGEVVHRDSLGSHQVIRPGELNLMTAGHGISHSEESPPGATGALHGVQLWVAQPEAARDGPPAFEHHAALPVLHEPGIDVTVLLGRLDDLVSPALAFTPIVGAEVRLAAGSAGRLPLEMEWEHAVLALSGDVFVDGVEVPRGSLLHLGRGRPDLPVASAGAGRALLLGGEPFDERLLMWWNFVGRTHEDVEQARLDWEAGRTGALDPPRFGVVDGYAGSALPAPALPGTRLVPRSNR